MAAKKKTFWNFFDNLEGDKVVWMIVLMLILASVLCIFSSTSRLLDGDETRLDMVRNQFLIVILGLGIIILCYNIKSMELFKWFSKFGFIISFILLLLLDIHIKTPFVKAINLNDAYRILQIEGVQIHVFEVVKVAMIMYIAWTLDYIKKNGATLKRKILMLYLPFVTTFTMVIPGSNSSALFIAGVMFLTIVIGGGSLKDMMMLAGLGVVMLGLVMGIYGISGGKAFKRIGTGISRVFVSEDHEQIFLDSKPNTIEWQDALDKIRQPYGAKIAIHEGGLIGKGPGQSTQRYVVPDMSEDYMYSFIIEEYGLLGGILILVLYLSLLARGSIIARNCGKDIFAKSAVAGLCLLISGQAFLHMFVNVDIGPMTGQTLPLVSHGNSAFLCFSLAFGILLSFSRIAARRIEREQRESAPLFELHESVQADLADLVAFESGEMFGEEENENNG